MVLSHRAGPEVQAQYWGCPGPAHLTLFMLATLKTPTGRQPSQKGERAPDGQQWDMCPRLRVTLKKFLARNLDFCAKLPKF